MSVYDRIRAEVKRKGMTLAFVNDAIGGYRGKMTDVKNGKVALNQSEIEIIASLLGVTVEYLLTGTETQKSPAPSEGNGVERQRIVDEYVLTCEDSAELMRIIALAAKRNTEITGK